MANKLFEGGSMPGVGPIHIDEINPTLDALEKHLGIDLKNNVLGSVGKKEFSGDIDVAIQVDADKIPELVKKIEACPLIMDIAKSSVIMTKVKIEGYDESKQTTKPRTGYVQVDFMPGDPEWMKTYYHSPSDKESKYKGVFRNLMIATIAAIRDSRASGETIDDGRPAEIERWIWSPSDGLVRIKRVPAQRKDGKGYTKKNIDTPVQKPIKNPDEIAKALGLDGAKDLNSFESLLAAVEKNLPAEEVQKIKDSFANNGTVKDVGVPDELVKKESLSDKHLNRILKLSGYNQYEV